MEEAEDAEGLFIAMMKEITQPDIPPEVKEVRVMSLHKSKGLSSPYVFIAQCVQGVLPRSQSPEHPEGRRGCGARRAAPTVFRRDHPREGREPITQERSTFRTPKRCAELAKQLDVPFTKVNYGQAQLTPSIFIGELGPDRRRSLLERSNEGRDFSHADVAGYYAASLMERGHQITISEGGAIYAPGLKPYIECDCALLLSDELDLREIADYMEASGKPIYRNLSEVP